MKRSRHTFSAALCVLLLASGIALCDPVTLDLLTDSFGSETYFNLVDILAPAINIPFNSPSTGNFADGIVTAGELASSGAYLFTWDNLGPGTYDFTIRDTFGDGICCLWGYGSYDLKVDGLTVRSGGAFSTSETTRFSIENGEIPEPATIGLVALGLAGFAIWRRRRAA